MVLKLQVNLYMTHFGNYAHDRLGPYVFDRVFEFIRAWTHLRVKWAPMWRLVEHHLVLNPGERPEEPTSMPLHSNPCRRKALRVIWFEGQCLPDGGRLPGAVIVGPKKTGQ